MPTDKYRVTITIPDEMTDKIRDYQYYNRIRTQSQAVVNLINAGLRTYFEQPAVNSGLSSTAIQFATQMDNLSPQYQKILFAMLETMQESAALSASGQA